ncbi:riboflavin synthase [Thermodesulfobacteriota bacterium]
MFTGLIAGIGKVTGVNRIGGGIRLSVKPLFSMTDVKIGDSISVDGVCLTVAEFTGNSIEMDVSGETISRSTLEYIKKDAEVNLEPALRLTDRLGGHIVSGHVDGIGKIGSKEQQKRSWIVRIKINKQLSQYIVEKGSIAVDGISLTVNHCDEKSFDISIIPHTGTETTLLKKGIGDSVNIETDIIGKYVEKFLLGDSSQNQKDEKTSGLDLKTLIKYGFGD